LPALAIGAAARAAETTPAAADARRYVAISLIGDKYQVMGNRGQSETGSMLTLSRLAEVPMPGAPCDRAVLEALVSEVPKADPRASVSCLAASAPAFFEDQDEWFDGKRLALPAQLHKAVLREQGESLLLVTKHRGRALVRGASGRESMGGVSGRFEGLGFYRDGATAVVVVDEEGQAREHDNGFVAPFVYVKLSLVDIATFTVVRDKVIEHATPLVISSPGKHQPLAQTLESMLREDVEFAVQGVVRPA